MAAIAAKSLSEFQNFSEKFASAKF